MPDSTFVALFFVGFLGGTHCIGMCGGIVGALSLGADQGRIPWSRHWAYNGGRLTSYVLAGALAGAVGAAGSVLAGQLPVRLLLYLFANLMLLAFGLYLLGVTRALAFTERLGQHLWRRLQPLGKRLLPARNARQAWGLGLLWGWLPCGLVYSALATSLAAGSAWRGGLTMLAFGLGTLPNLLAMGLFASRLQALAQKPWVRRVAGAMVLGFGVGGLLGSWRLAQTL